MSLDREVREVTLAGQIRTLAQAPIPAADIQTIRMTEPHFINDTLLLLRNNSGVGSVNLRTGAAKQLYTGNIRPRNEFGVSADGNWIAFAAWEGDKSVPTLLSLSSGEVRRVPYSLGAELGPVFFHPDGRHLVAPACLRCSIEKFDIVMIPLNGDPTRVLTAGLAQYVDFWFPSSSPDGRSIVFGGDLSWSSRLVTLTLPRSP
jgi:Tol biopolymer transport system component